MGSLGRDSWGLKGRTRQARARYGRKESKWESLAGYWSRKIGGGGGGVNICATLAGRAASSAFVASVDATGAAGRAASCAGRRSRPSLWTATSGITGTDEPSLPCLCCIFPCRARPRIDNQPCRFGCKQAPPTANVAARVSGCHLNGVAHKNSKDSSSTW